MGDGQRVYKVSKCVRFTEVAVKRVEFGWLSACISSAYLDLSIGAGADANICGAEMWTEGDTSDPIWPSATATSKHSTNPTSARTDGQPLRTNSMQDCISASKASEAGRSQKWEGDKVANPC